MAMEHLEMTEIVGATKIMDIDITEELLKY